MASFGLRRITLMTLILLVAVPCVFGTTLYVGTCRTPSYTTISAAVAAAAPLSTISVCPGTYPEQVVVTKVLTLQGIANGNNDRAKIVVPPNVTGGATPWTFIPDPDGSVVPVAAQLLIQLSGAGGTGTVKISNITIDGTGDVGPSACSASSGWQTVAVFLVNTPGSLNNVSTTGQGHATGCGAGVRDFSAVSPPVSFSMTNTSVQNASSWGVLLEGTLTATLNKNWITVPGSGIASYGGSGTISSNFVQSGSSAIQAIDLSNGDSWTISTNTIVAAGNSPDGISLNAYLGQGSAVVTGNTIVAFAWGISVNLNDSGAYSFQKNTLVNNQTGMDLGCDASVTLSGNNIKNAGYGFDNIPAPLSLTGNTFANTDQEKRFVCP